MFSDLFGTAVIKFWGKFGIYILEVLRGCVFLAAANDSGSSAGSVLQA